MRGPGPAGQCRHGRLSLSLGEHWLEFLLRNGAHALEQVCRDLPAPWNEDPEMLMVSSVCRALDGDGTGCLGTHPACAGAYLGTG